MKIKSTMIVLFIIVLITGYFRFNRIDDTDFVSVDEYWYYTGAEIGNMLHDIIFNFRETAATHKISDYIILIKRLPDGAARPGYNFINAVATVFFRESKQTAIGVTGFFAILTVLLLYKIVAVLFGRRAGLMAGLLLAVNGSHVLFTRISQPIPLAAAFLTAAFIFYLQRRQPDKNFVRYTVFSAVCCGLAFTTHPGALYLAPVLFVVDLHYFISGGGKNSNAGMIFREIKAYVIFTIVFFSLILIWELPHAVMYAYAILTKQITWASGYLNSLVPINNISSYFNEILSLFHGEHCKMGQNADFLFFPSFIMDSQGVFYFIVFVLALIYAAVNFFKDPRQNKYLFLLSWFLVTYILHSLPVGKREIRVYMLSAPAIPAILAVFLDGLIFSKKKKLLTGLTGIIILLAAVFTGVLYSATAIATRYTHKPVIEYLARHPEIDKVLMNTNTMGQGGTSDKMCNWTLGFYVCDFWVYSPDNNGVFVHKNGGRAAVYYRNIHEAEKKPPYIIGHPWICWPENVLAWYKEGKIKYYLSSPLDMQIFHDNDPKVQPIFSYPSPLIYRARLYEMFSSLDAIKTCHESPFYRQIGIYDISVMLEVI